MISHLKFRKILKSERNGYLQKLEKISTANKDDHLQLKFREISARKRKFHISKNFDKQQKWLPEIQKNFFKLKRLVSWVT